MQLLKFVIAIIMINASNYVPIQSIAQTLPITQLPSIEITMPEWGHINDVQFSPSGEMLAVASNSGLNILDGDLQAIANLESHFGEVYSVSWDRNGTKLASGGEDGKVIVWDMLELSQTYLTPLTTLQDVGPVYYVEWSPDVMSNLLATRTVTRREAASDSIYIETDIKVWNTLTSELVRTLASLAYSATEISWNATGTQLAAAGSTEGQGSRLLVWNLQNGEVVTTSTEQQDQIRSLAWKPHSNFVSFTDWTGVVESYDVIQKERVNVFGYDIGTTQSQTLAWNADGTLLALGSRVGYVLIYNFSTGELLAQLEYPDSFIYSLDWSYQGNRIVAIVGDDTLYSIDVSSLHLFIEMS